MNDVIAIVSGVLFEVMYLVVPAINLPTISTLLLPVFLWHIIKIIHVTSYICGNDNQAKKCQF